jgi:endonuclease/exonuclease/phosphatase (EEP) superfamily protein YafD
MPALRDVRRALVAGLAIALAGCVIVPDAQRMITLSDNGRMEVERRPCDGHLDDVRPAIASPGALDSESIRIASWNLHKGADDGWRADLARIAASNDIVLLQEALLDPDLESALDAAGLRWQLASSFTLNGRDAGVLTAARVRPIAACTQWSLEPLLALPKSTLVTRFRLSGRDTTLAIANLHAINFTLSAGGAYRSQLETVRAELATHRGPVVFAGDFNTWNDGRRAAVEAVARDLGLAPVAFRPDVRQRFAGYEVDYIYVRGLEVIAATSIEVVSSDHNPVFATLRLQSQDD